MLKNTILALAIIVSLANLALGQNETEERAGFRGWGPRVGATIDPDQIHFGGHVDFGNFVERIRFQPNIEMGFGDHVTVVAVNFEGAYRFRSQWDVWTPYLGGGPGLNFYSLDDGDKTRVGLNILGGIEKGLSNGDRFFVEAKIGLGDAPDLKITAGWTFFH